MISTNAAYWQDVRTAAKNLRSDGCSWVADIHVDCCYEHDIHYRTGHRLDGTPITRREADARFRQCNMKHSQFGHLSPLAWWRWAGVRMFGRRAR